MKILYIDCFSGISGDMTVGALVDLGVDPAIIETELAKLKLEKEYRIEWKKVVKKGITATKMDVIIKGNTNIDKGVATHHHEHASEVSQANEGHNDFHDVEKAQDIQQHSHEKDDDHHHGGHGSDSKEKDHQKGHDQLQQPDHSHSHHHGHDHRHYKEIVFRIKEAGFNEAVTRYALEIFHQVAMAEGKIHNMPIEKVHFHEVGAIDSIVDIVATAICLDQLKPDKIVSAPVPVGVGKIWIDHGLYPVPAPATLEMLKNVPIQESHVSFEMTTPTGAGIVKALVDEFGRIPSMEVKEIGYGAGTKDFPDHPNVLRMIMGETFDF